MSSFLNRNAGWQRGNRAPQNRLPTTRTILIIGPPIILSLLSMIFDDDVILPKL
jgi:hypothetical protein